MDGNWKRSLEALLVWAIPLVIICAMVLHRPDQRTVVPVYHAASANWLNQETIYIGPLGMNYLPHFAVLYSPFHAMGVPAGDICWRIAITVFFVYSFYRLINLCPTGNRHWNFLLASLFAMPICLGAIRNGQANVLLGAVSALAAVFLIEKRLSAAAVTMAAAVAVKPLGAVMLMLAPFVYRRLALRVAIALVGLLALPFLFGPTDYVISQYQAFYQNLADCSSHGTLLRFSNIYGILSELSIPVSRNQMTFVGLAAASATLAAWLAVAKRGHCLSIQPPPNTETVDGETKLRCDSPKSDHGLMLLALTTSYLMLFNPMAESNGYVILAPAFAAISIRWINDHQHRRLGWFLASVMLAMGLLPEILRRIDPLFVTWWKPLSTVVFLGLLLRVTLRRSQANAVIDDGESTNNRQAA